MSENIGIGTSVTESRGGFGFNGYSFTKIARDTKTQWVCENGSRYKKDGLGRIGDYGRLQVTTPEHIQKNKICNLRSQIGSELYDLGNMRNRHELNSIEGLNKVLFLLKEARVLLEKGNRTKNTKGKD